MANPEHLEILAQGVDKWNQWRRDNFLVIPNLRGVVTDLAFDKASYGPDPTP
jgi:hypothetical protein